MAKKKKSAPARKHTTRRATRKTSRRRSGKRGVQMNSMMGALTEIGKGIVGGVLIGKVVPMVLKQFPTADEKLVYGGLTLGSAALAIKGGKQFAAVGIGAGIVSGGMLLNKVAPKLMGPDAMTIKGIGRATPEMQARMMRAAEMVRKGTIGADRNATITGDRNATITGDRNAVVTGTGYIDPMDY